MGWTQEDITEVYRTVKCAASKISPDGKTHAQITHAIRQDVKYKLGFRRVHRRTSQGWLEYSDHASNKKFKGFVKGKYRAMGLPSREQDMLSKMIDSVISNMEVNETSLTSLSDTVAKAEVVAARAKTLADDCEVIMFELNKIADRLDGNE